MCLIKPSNSKTRILAVAVCALGLVLAGCTENRVRSDKLTLDAGDAVARNKVVHMIDPWPRHAEHTIIGGDGKRMVGAVERYQNPEIDQTAAKPVSPVSTINK